MIKKVNDDTDTQVMRIFVNDDTSSPTENANYDHLGQWS